VVVATGCPSRAFGLLLTVVQEPVLRTQAGSEEEVSHDGEVPERLTQDASRRGGPVARGRTCRQRR
jgi:hypothetical protein